MNDKSTMKPNTSDNAISDQELFEILDRKQKNLEAIFDATPVCMILLDTHKTVARANCAVKKMTGKDYSEIIGRNVCEVIGCADVQDGEYGRGLNCSLCPINRAVSDAIDTQKPVHGVELQHNFRFKYSEVALWISINIIPTLIDNELYVVFSINDITDRKQAEEKFKEMMEIKSQFISTVSHELRTPLAAMKEGVSIVLDGFAGEINEDQRKFLNIAIRNVERLGMLINDVLDFQRLESGRINLDIQENDINQLVYEIHETMSLASNKKNVDLIMETDGGIPRSDFDGHKINQVITNLLSNAIKFTPDNGRVFIRTRTDDQNIIIEVEDTGMGIPKEDLPRIFERFYRVKRPGKEIKGTGLGLAIVNKIILMHHGKVEIESEVDHGTKFRVFLPMSDNAVIAKSSTAVDNVLEDKLIKKADQ